MRVVELRHSRRLWEAALTGCGCLITIVQTASAQTWTPTSAPNLDWLSVSSFADRSRLLAGGYSALDTSTNAGENWTTNNVPLYDWACVACSAEGNQLAAAAGNVGITSPFHVGRDRPVLPKHEC